MQRDMAARDQWLTTRRKRGERRIGASNWESPSDEDTRQRTEGRVPMLAIVGWILFGLIVGLVAKLVTPGQDPGGIVMTTALGIVGAILGGFVGRLLGLYQAGEGAGYIMATLGAVLILFVYRQVSVRA